VSALSARILDLLENGSGLSKLSKNGKKKVATVFNWDIISKDVLAVYETVMKNA
jgi:glycosyltransferase involved in cell wall biosynthesis